MAISAAKALLKTQIASACEALSPVWPIENFIAVNHAQNLTALPFIAAMQKLHLTTAAQTLPDEEWLDDMRKQGNIDELSLRRFENKERTKQKLTEKIVNFGSADNSSLNQVLFSKQDLFNIADWLTFKSGLNYSERLNKEMQRWCAAFFDRNISCWNMPGREAGFYKSWKKLAIHDLKYRYLSSAYIDRLKNLPNTSEDAILDFLLKFGIDESDATGYLKRHVLQMPGWASFAINCEVNPDRPQDHHALTDYLAIRLFYEAEFFSRSKHQQEYVSWHHAREVLGQAQKEKSDEVGDGFLKRYRLLGALEQKYEYDLLDKIRTKLTNPVPDNQDKTCQAKLVFCIDARSEGIRRHLEFLTKNIQTVGFAGFFGYPVNFANIATGKVKALCPVLLKPKYTIGHRKDSNSLIEKWLSGNFAEQIFQTLMQQLRNNLLAKFYFVEAAGIWTLPLALLKNFIPNLLNNVSNLSASSRLPSVSFSIEQTKEDDLGMPLEDRLFYSEASLKAMGLTEDFPPIVCFVGHGSASQNNPYEAALDCGACGGNTGAVSARLAATILNQVAVRHGLVERGIFIPEGTVFIAAEHNTTCDDVTFHELPSFNAEQSRIFTALRDSIRTACEHLRAERAEFFINTEGRNPLLRSVDWSQTRPEWGLAKNAAFIAAPRSLTSGLNLERRAFLHDYTDSKDPENKVLELIMTAPLVVAQWINMQYYLSSVDPNIFSSGTKITQNVVANVGVMQGCQSDLKLGLPKESVAVTHDSLFHEPIRLLVLIAAKKENIDKVLTANSSIQDLVANEWINLIALEDNKFYRCFGSGLWHRVEETNDLGAQNDLTAQIA